jgi:flagellar biogenesis protein FliO
MKPATPRRQRTALTLLLVIALLLAAMWGVYRFLIAPSMSRPTQLIVTPAPVVPVPPTPPAP